MNKTFWTLMQSRYLYKIMVAQMSGDYDAHMWYSKIYMFCVRRTNQAANYAWDT